MEAAKPSYVREVLTSQTNLYAGLGSLALGVVLSIPFGFGIGALPLIAFAAGDILAALHIPSLFALGLVLFVITFAVLAAAKWLIASGASRAGV